MESSVEVETGPISKLSFARGLISAASKLYPASDVTQGAYIALRCKQKHIGNPQSLGDVLSSDPDSVDHLTKAAQLMHRKRKIHVPVSAHEIIGIIESDFSKAQELMILSEAELETLLNKYTRGMSQHINRTEIHVAVYELAIKFIDSHKSRPDNIQKE